MKLHDKIGVMQGRLLPKYRGRYQAHPVGYWEDEFPIAADLELSFIEFILDYNEVQRNPLMSPEGLNKILDLSSKYGIRVTTVCADFFMEYPLHSDLPEIRRKSKETLKKLIHQCEKIGITDIVIPCVDRSSLLTCATKKHFVESLKPLIDYVEKRNVNLCLETDLDPVEFVNLLNEIGSNNVTVNYDTGNSAFWGYKIHEEFNAYGKRISDIHIKDRTYSGESVMLGEGAVDFNLFLKQIASINYEGPLIFQAYRDDHGIDIFIKQLEWFKNLLQNDLHCNYQKMTSKE